MTHDQENVLYWLIGAAKFGYLDLDYVLEWSGSNMDSKDLAVIIDQLWDLKEAKAEVQ